MTQPLPRPRERRGFRSWGRLVLGWMILLIGIVLTPTPLPLGVPLIACALVMLAAESPALQRLIRRSRARLPGVSAWLERHKGRMPSQARLLIDSTAPAGVPAD